MCVCVTNHPVWILPTSPVPCSLPTSLPLNQRSLHSRPPWPVRWPACPDAPPPSEPLLVPPEISEPIMSVVLACWFGCVTGCYCRVFTLECFGSILVNVNLRLECEEKRSPLIWPSPFAFPSFIWSWGTQPSYMCCCCWFVGHVSFVSLLVVSVDLHLLSFSSFCPGGGCSVSVCSHLV